MERPVDAPEQVWSDLKEAAKWLGLGEGEFKAEVKAYPDLLPFEEIGKGHKWYWMDLVVYAWARRGRGKRVPAEAPLEE